MNKRCRLLLSTGIKSNSPLWPEGHSPRGHVVKQRASVCLLFFSSALGSADYAVLEKLILCLFLFIISLLFQTEVLIYIFWRRVVNLVQNNNSFHPFSFLPSEFKCTFLQFLFGFQIKCAMFEKLSLHHWNIRRENIKKKGHFFFS